MTNVILPYSVTKIGVGCFQYCSNLKHINTDNIIEFKSCCFVGCKNLEQLNLNNCKSIDEKCFEGCDKLKI